jgi:hypothetical protein
VISFGIQKRELKNFLEKSLNKREKELFLALENYQGTTFSCVVKRLANRYPESTIKLVLKRLKSFQLLEFGDAENKGKSLAFTLLGEVFSEILRDDEK